MVLKVIELLGSSSKSWEDAAQKVAAEAARSLRNVRSLNVQNMSCVVDNGAITAYRVNCKVAFAVENEGPEKPKDAPKDAPKKRGPKKKS